MLMTIILINDFNFTAFVFISFSKNINENKNSIKIEKVAVKGTVSSRSEQTFNMAWNRCPSLRWTQWLKITGSFMQQQR